MQPDGEAKRLIIMCLQVDLDTRHTGSLVPTIIGAVPPWSMRWRRDGPRAGEGTLLHLNHGSVLIRHSNSQMEAIIMHGQAWHGRTADRHCVCS